MLSFSEVCAEDMSPEDISSDRLSFYRFDISRLLKHGASLLGSAGAEFELQDDKSGRVLSLICVLTLQICNIHAVITLVCTWGLRFVQFLNINSSHTFYTTDVYYLKCN